MAVHDDYLGLLLGDGGGDFSGMTSMFISNWGSWEADPMPLTLMSGDLNGDSTSDLILHGTLLSNQYLVTCAVIGNGDGLFGEPIWIPDSYGGSAVMADLNADGRTDFATTSSNVVWDGSTYQYRGWVDVWLANGDGTFRDGWRHVATSFSPMGPRRRRFQQ